MNSIAETEVKIEKNISTMFSPYHMATWHAVYVSWPRDVISISRDVTERPYSSALVTCDLTWGRQEWKCGSTGRLRGVSMYIQGLHLSRRTCPSHPDASGYIRSAVQSQKAVTAYLTGQQLLPSDLAEQRCGRGRGGGGCPDSILSGHVTLLTFRITSSVKSWIENGPTSLWLCLTVQPITRPVTLDVAPMLC